MTIILIVETSGNVREMNVKKLQISDVYKKAGFKSPEGMTEPVICWPRPNIDPFVLDYQVQVFGKKKGRAGQENKYDFPPPIDSALFFGSMVMVAVRPDGTVVDLTLSAWEMIYEQLFGGFEDLDDTREHDAATEESEENVVLTKDGYMKDDFVGDWSEEDAAEESSEEFEVVTSKKNRNKKCIKSVVETEPKPIVKLDTKTVGKKANKVKEIEEEIPEKISKTKNVKKEKTTMVKPVVEKKEKKREKKNKNLEKFETEMIIENEKELEEENY